MISDWTIYGYVGDGEVLCPDCFKGRAPEGATFTLGDLESADSAEPGGWHGLLSIADTEEEGLNCGQCGEYIFEPRAEYMHAEYGHAEYVSGCYLCTAVEELADTWAAEHEAGEHQDAPALGPTVIQEGWHATMTAAGCPDCEREHAPAPGQLELGS